MNTFTLKYHGVTVSFCRGMFPWQLMKLIVWNLWLKLPESFGRQYNVWPGCKSQNGQQSVDWYSFWILITEVSGMTESLWLFSTCTFVHWTCFWMLLVVVSEMTCYWRRILLLITVFMIPVLKSFKIPVFQAQRDVEIVADKSGSLNGHTEPRKKQMATSMLPHRLLN